MCVELFSDLLGGVVEVLSAYGDFHRDAFRRRVTFLQQKSALHITESLFGVLEMAGNAPRIAIYFRALC